MSDRAVSSEDSALCCAGRHDEQGLASGEVGEIAGRSDRRIELNPGRNSRVFVDPVDRRHDVGLERPQQDVLRICGCDLRERGSPGAAADDPELHAFTPAPRTFSALRRAASAREPARIACRSARGRIAPTPAQAIIAALSVHSHAGGTLK